MTDREHAAYLADEIDTMKIVEGIGGDWLIYVSPEKMHLIVTALRALSPPVVTDEMVERALDAWWSATVWSAATDRKDMRAALEAALGVKETTR